MTVYGDLNVGTFGLDELGVSTGEMLRASAAQAIDDMPMASAVRIQELETAKAGDSLGDAIERVQGGEDPADVIYGERPPLTKVPIVDARARVKAAGLEKELTLPDEDIADGALSIMMARAKDRYERKTTIARGPDGFMPSALSVGTSFLLQAVDPINVASAFIPVVGEVRYARALAGAGESLVSRALARAPLGAIEGAAGAAVVEPLIMRGRWHEGADYTMGDFLTSLAFGAGLGSGLHVGAGGARDIYRARRGEAQYPFGPGEPMARGAPQVESIPPSVESRPDAPAEIPRDHPSPGFDLVPEPAPRDGYVRFYHGYDEGTLDGQGSRWVTPDRDYAANFRGEKSVAYVDIKRGSPEELALRGWDEIDERGGSSIVGHYRHGEIPEAVAQQLRPMLVERSRPSPVLAAIEDLPGQAKQDLMAGAIAAVTRGESVRAGEMLEAAGRTDGRIAESLALADRPRFRGEPLPDVGVAPANMARDGTIYVGEKNGLHFLISEAHGASVRKDFGLKPGESTWQREGFVTPDGVFLDRQDAFDWVTANEKKIRASENMVEAGPDGSEVKLLDALDYQEQVPNARRRGPTEAVPNTPSGPDTAAFEALGKRTEDPESLAASQAADKVAEPDSLKQNARVAAAERFAAEADELYKASEPYIPDDVKAKVDADLKELKELSGDRATALERGAACLAAAA